MGTINRESTTDAPAPEPSFQVGDLVRCHFRARPYQKTIKIFRGVITRISDGSERRIPGEVMYCVHREGHGPTWMHRDEIVEKLDAESVLHETAELYWTSMVSKYPPELAGKVRATIARVIMERTQGGK